MQKNTLFEFLRTAIAILIAILLAFIIIFFISKDPLSAINEFLLGPISSFRHFGNVIEMVIPLIFASLAVSVMFQAKQFNMGAEGSFFIGAVAAAAIGIKFKLPGVIHPLVAIAAGGIVGGAANFIPAFLKARWKASELVSSLMLNYIMFDLGIYFINYYLRDPYAGAMVSYQVNPTANLPQFIPRTRIHAGVFIAILAVIVVYYFLYRTRWGFALRMTGINSMFADYSGINTNMVILYSQVIGGVIAGVGGATELLGMYQRFQWQALPGYGFDGIIVAILARNNPLLIPVAAIFLAYLRIGADLMSRMTDVPSEMVAVIQAIMIMLIAAEAFLSYWRHKMVVREAKIDA